MWRLTAPIFKRSLERMLEESRERTMKRLDDQQTRSVRRNEEEESSASSLSREMIGNLRAVVLTILPSVVFGALNTWSTRRSPHRQTLADRCAGTVLARVR
jgi:hypothetical protein